MTVSHRYRNFGKRASAQPKNESFEQEAFEEEKLKSFEAGYQAGWDDAIKAKSEEKANISAEFGQNLQDISFTYHEALTKLTSSMEPVMKEIISKLLPEIVQQALAVHIIEQLKTMLNEHVTHPIEIVVAASNVETVRELGAEKITAPFEVVSESSLGEGQAFVRVGDSERQVDLDSVVSGVASAMKAFFHEAKEVTDHD